MELMDGGLGEVAEVKAVAETIEPLDDRLVVRRPEAEDEVTEWGIFIPAHTQDPPQVSEVLAVGPGRMEGGVRVPLAVEVGDRVLFGKYAGTEVEVEGEAVVILREGDVFAVVRGWGQRQRGEEEA